MPKQHVRTISTGPARCRRCTAISVITVRESRYVRSFGDLLDRAFDPSPTRTAHCSGCGVTYPIRSTDATAEPAAARRGAADAPRGRDWRYPPAQDDRRFAGA